MSDEPPVQDSSDTSTSSTTATQEPGTSSSTPLRRRLRDFAKNALGVIEPDGMDSGKGWRWSLSRTIYSLLLFLVVMAMGAGFSTWYALRTTPQQVKAEDEAQEELDQEKDAIDAKLRSRRWATNDPAEYVWEFRRRLDAEDLELLKSSASSAESLSAAVQELGGRRVSGIASSEGAVNSIFMNLTLSTARESLITVTDIFAKKVRCSNSKTKAVIAPSVGEGYPRDGIVFDFNDYEVGEKIPALAEKYDGERYSRAPYLNRKGVALQKGLSPSEFTISIDSNIGCEWSLNITYESQGDDKEATFTVKDQDGENPAFNIAHYGDGVQRFSIALNERPAYPKDPSEGYTIVCAGYYDCP